MRHFNVSLIVWAKSQDSVHKPQFWKRKESQNGSNRGPSAYKPSALPLGHTGSLTMSAFIIHQLTIFRLCTGHGCENHHLLTKFKTGQSELCTCQTDNLTTEHLLQACPQHDSLTTEHLLQACPQHDSLRRQFWPVKTPLAVSYTHLTLPTRRTV